MASIVDQLPKSSPRPILTFDMGALQANYAYLQSLAPKTEIAGVVKANGYGCGAKEVASALGAVGCKTFFVTSLEEALHLRGLAGLQEATIYTFNGCFKEEQSAFQINRISPLLNSLEEWQSWTESNAASSQVPSYGLHVDTGMNRQGMSLDDAQSIASALDGESSGPDLVISHLASADNAGAPFSAEQRKRFEAVKSWFGNARHSLANSAGLHLGRPYHLDVARPGIALYGGQPLTGKAVPLKPVAHLHAPILQTRVIQAGESVGYGETFRAARKARIATLPLGYADGILRSLSNNGFVSLGGRRAPIVGRISMDLTTVDVSEIPEELSRPGAWAEVLGETISVDDMGKAAGSFSYEILTSLGNRYERRYIGLSEIS